MRKDDGRSKSRQDGLGKAAAIISGRYQIAILYCLSKNEALRFNELKRELGPIAFRTLSLVLKKLEVQGVVSRKEYKQIPPKVEYRLTRYGMELVPILEQLRRWGSKADTRRRTAHAE